MNEAFRKRQSTILINLQDAGVISTKRLAKWTRKDPRTAARWISGQAEMPANAIVAAAKEGGPDVRDALIDGLINLPAGRVTVCNLGDAESEASLAAVLADLSSALAVEVAALQANGSVCRREADQILETIHRAMRSLSHYAKSVDLAGSQRVFKQAKKPPFSSVQAAPETGRRVDVVA